LVAIGEGSTPQEGIEEKNFHEKHIQQENLESLFDYPHKFVEETKEPWTTFNGGKTLGPEIEESIASLCLDSLCKSQIFEHI